MTKFKNRQGISSYHLEVILFDLLNIYHKSIKKYTEDLLILITFVKLCLLFVKM